MASAVEIGKFSFKTLHDGFDACMVEDDDIDVDKYIQAYKELYKFLLLMGKIFGFVSSDIKSKLDLLEEMRLKDTEGNIKTVKKMIAYEKEEGLLQKKGYVSGSRTVLRLHRGLDFISLFLQRVGEVENQDGTASICQEAYNKTLADHHTWVIRKAAGVAMYAMPTKENLLIKLFCGDQHEIQVAKETLPEMLKASREVHRRTQNLLEANDCLALP